MVILRLVLPPPSKYITSLEESGTSFQIRFGSAVAVRSFVRSAP